MEIQPKLKFLSSFILSIRHRWMEKSRLDIPSSHFIFYQSTNVMIGNEDIVLIFGWTIPLKEVIYEMSSQIPKNNRCLAQ